MKRPASKILAVAIAAGVTMIGVTAARVATRAPEPSCGPGFWREGPRCVPARRGECPKPLVPTPHGCDAPEDDTVLVPAMSVMLGPSDWEAEGRVKPRLVKAGPFRIDRFEVTVGRAFCPQCPLADATRFATGPERAATGVTLDEARAYCTHRKGRLPTDDEWIVAAAGDPTRPEKARRYPWGDTGAVCRRAAFGLVKGPCGEGLDGADTIGAHPDGATPLGVHDLAGNAEEWVEGGGEGDPRPAVRGGSYATALATELRIWPRRIVDPTTRDKAVGFRCVNHVP